MAMLRPNMAISNSIIFDLNGIPSDICGSTPINIRIKLHRAIAGFILCSMTSSHGVGRILLSRAQEIANQALMIMSQLPLRIARHCVRCMNDGGLLDENLWLY